VCGGGGGMWSPNIFSWPTPYGRQSTENARVCHKAKKFLSLLWSGIPLQNAKNMRCLILIAWTVKVPILWYLTLCNLVQMYRRFERTSLLHKNGRRRRWEAISKHLIHTDQTTPRYVWQENMFIKIIIIITIIITINCNWVVTRWQWLFYIYTNYEIGY